jgi:cell division septation protein DedD
MPDPDDGPRIVMDGGLETSVTTDKIKEKVITGDPVDAAVNVRAVYAVQVGAFKGGREAERMVNRLTKRGYPAYIVVADVPGQGRLHKVRIGRFDHRAEADRTARRVRKKEGLQTFVTIR